ncbi:MAG: hypothetical protein ABSF12_05080 [Bryobacteraceae bacterium]
MRIIVSSLLLLLLTLAGCSSPPATDTKQGKKTGPIEPTSAVPTKKHPLAKYVELVGFRLEEAGGGKLRVKFVVVNHSEADIGDLGVKVRLMSSSSKPEDPPIAEFEVKVPTLGPEEIQDVVATVPSKLRIYELPDWQFLKAEFEITSPQP